MTMTVLSAMSTSSARLISCSLSASRLEVDSSNSTMGAFLMSARAMEMRCFSPPESVEPPSPTRVS